MERIGNSWLNPTLAWLTLEITLKGSIKSCFLKTLGGPATLVISTTLPCLMDECVSLSIRHHAARAIILMRGLIHVLFTHDKQRA